MLTNFDRGNFIVISIDARSKLSKKKKKKKTYELKNFGVLTQCI